MKKIFLFASILAIVFLIGLVNGVQVPMTATIGSSAPTIDSVVVNDVPSPNAGSTTQITITSQITDTNGVDDITVVNSSFTVGNPANGKTVTTMNRSICTNVDVDTIQCIATYNMQFYDPAQSYTVQVYAQDNANTTGTGTDPFSYGTVQAFSLDTSSVAFGSLSVGGTGNVNGDTNMGTPLAPTLQNTGNVMIDVGMLGTDLVGSGDTINVFYAGYRFDSESYINMTTSKLINDVNVSVGANSYKKIDFRLTVPSGSLPGTYSGNVTVTAE